MLKLQKIVSLGMTMMMLAGGLFALMPVASAQVNNDPTGIGYGSGTGLGTKDLRVTIANIIKVAMGLLGIVAVVIILIGGFTWMTAGGNTEKVDQAKGWIFSGIIGLAIILSAYAIASFVITQLVTATSGGGNGQGI